MRTHILMVDNDPMTNKMLTFLLNDHAYQTTTLSDPRQVRDFLCERVVDLILLDVALPHFDGFTLCTHLRREHPNVPVIFLSRRSLVSDIVDGFDHGGDDFVAKPFDPTELLARIQAVLRRYRRTERDVFETIIKVGEIRLNLGDMQVDVPHRDSILLTPTEMKILECLMRNANAIVSREALIERTWGYDFEGTTNRVEVYIGRLRKKIEADPDKPTLIRTVRGIGYVFRSDQSAVEGTTSGTQRTIVA